MVKEMKKLFCVIVLLVSMMVGGSLYAASSDVTLKWDHSIDYPYLKSYRVFYYPTTGNPESLTSSLYAISYVLVGSATPVPINSTTDPKAIVIDRINTQITLNGLQDGTWYFAVTAIDTRGIESIPTPEISTALKTIIYPPNNTRVITITIRTVPK